MVAKMRKIFIHFSLIFLIPLGFVHSQDLSGGGPSYFENLASRPVGSIIYLQLGDDFNFDFSAETQVSLFPNSTLRAAVSELFPFLPSSQTSDPTTKNLQIEIDEETEGMIGATIVSYSPDNDTYGVTASKSVNYNGKDRSLLTISGNISASDIDGENTIAANKVANLTINYTDVANRVNLSERDFESLLEVIERANGEVIDQNQTPATGQAAAGIGDTQNEDETALAQAVPPPQPQPTQTETVRRTELTEARKRQIYLQFVNWLLSSWY